MVATSKNQNNQSAFWFLFRSADGITPHNPEMPSLATLVLSWCLHHG